ncbi:Retrovirus-related Pol polyprotein from transposon TNT 1-94 [Dendrobium catenatum]|uniref:Retrovirus-related Pol polyprotein from transposon TNT 1-94 n=1 Tax=Dendrobium catenatum TaxID=906689 RepID=A0A2I0XET0_9ASPA|nr:Retrovirus-related Pol polyprotein from transposon TNT 1-94 [Dendrobium catenatum]
MGHSAINCWHRCNLSYAPPTNQRALTAQQQQAATGDWILDSGASSHLTADINNLQQSTPYNGLDSISIANGSNLSIANSGQGILPLPDSNSKLNLKNILHVPSISHNLLSVLKLTSDNNISISFTAHEFVIKHLQDNQVLLRGPIRNGLYHIKLPINREETALHSAPTQRTSWHARLGHPQDRKIQHLAQQIPEIHLHSHNNVCISCNVSKSHKQTFARSISVCNKPFQLVHSDVWGPSPSLSFNGFRFYVIFVYDFTRFMWLYLLQTKAEVFTKFQQFCALVNTKFNSKIQTLRTDGGGEYNSSVFRDFLLQQGITHQMSCPHTPEQNGTAERKHRHLIELTRTLLHAASMPNSFWAEAVSTANYLINHLPSSALNNKTPYAQLHGVTTSYNHLKTFGCLCFPWTKPYASSKLHPRSHECIFLGYSTQHKGYRC